MLSMAVGFLTLFYSRLAPFAAIIDLSNRRTGGRPLPFQPSSFREGSLQSTTNQSKSSTGSNYNVLGSPCTWMANNRCLVCAAYYDNRTGLSITPSVTAVGYRYTRSKDMFQCHLVYSNQSVVVVNTTVNQIWDWQQELYHMAPSLFVCKLPSEEVPNILSLTTMQEIAPKQLPSIIVKYTRTQEHKSPYVRTFAMCVMSPLYNFSDAQALVEFFEMSRILGAEHFTVYTHSVTNSVSKVLNQYIREGVAEVVDWKMPILSDGHSIRYYGQLVAMHDCLYRNMHTVKYLVFNDIDEVIVPRQHNNWTQMMAEVQSAGSFLVRNVFYFTKTEGHSEANIMEGFNRSMIPCPTMRVPKYYQNWYRQKDAYKAKVRSKYMVRPRTIRKLHVHFVLDHLPRYSTYNVPEEVAIVQHYRKPEPPRPPPPLIIPDIKMLDYTPELINAIGEYVCDP